MDLLWLILFFSVSPIAVKMAMKLYILVPYFVGSLIYMLLFSLFEIQVPKTPDSIVYIAKLCIGSYIGLSLKREAIQFSTKIVFLGIASTAIFISFTYVFSFPLHVWLNERF
ncbi:hypothetical protein EK386_02740 [Lysinibacillus antri]|uniref:Uncharacterized protein n=1 Tax=Lysinibacillus antri TaxID=2498145 RepID=A0A432LIF2_9BACI|nr:hypothetical protein EK386_02740 [Lysinibacillus antri]